MKKIIIICIVMSLLIPDLFAQKSGYHVTDSFHIKSPGWWDYIAVNNNKLYVLMVRR